MNETQNMDIKIDDLSGGQVIELLEQHLADIYANSPPENVHALDINHAVALWPKHLTSLSEWKSSIETEGINTELL